MSTIKYQIFVSSTYEDLKDERDEVIKAILEMGHIPVGMEMFSAADQEQWKLIAKQIDQSDYYIVIVAHRYGSVTGKKSYTEKEHDYAVEKGIPIIAFIIDDSAPWPKDRMELDNKKIESLKKFKQKLTCKLVGFWSSKEDLGGKVSRSLVKLMTTSPRPGWVRTTETVGPEVVSEMSRLSSECARLNSENIQLKKQLEESLKIENSYYSQGSDLAKIKFNFSINKKTYKFDFEISWDDLFLEIGRKILENNREYSVFNKVIEIINRRKDSFPLLLDISEKDFSPDIDLEDISKIKIQFLALGYIDVFVAKSEINTNSNLFPCFSSYEPSWILTELGKRKLSELSAIRRHK